MKIFFAFLLLASTEAFAGDPHAFDVAAKLLSHTLVTTEVAKYPNHYFSSLVFEESYDAWTEHVFSLKLFKRRGSGPKLICFWVDYDEKLSDPVTRILPNTTSCD